ncbi:MAG: hypothetical protein JSU86_19595 [Phycisphaerales bacterium]|nr:MAG: hypothetical protein JSU86_19595 [Phycisphaerales bacterium]
MKVALLQIRLDPKSRAGNLQALSKVIEEAARADPAPDLLVLPGACDTGGAVSGRGWSNASLEGATEYLAWKARDWGVFIAAGSHVRHGDTREPCAVLFDPDGDAVARSSSLYGEEFAQSIGGAELWASDIGDLGVFEPSITSPLPEYTETGNRCAVIAVPTMTSLAGKPGRNVEANITSLQSDATVGRYAYWAVVTEAGAKRSPGDGNGPGTFLRAPTGKILASADGPEEAVVVAEVPIGNT